MGEIPRKNVPVISLSPPVISHLFFQGSYIDLLTSLYDIVSHIEIRNDVQVLQVERTQVDWLSSYNCICSYLAIEHNYIIILRINLR